MNTMRMMPLGDSITRGLISPPPGVIPGGYRTRLYQLLTRAGRAIEFVGSASDNPDPDNLPSSNHEGHGGWRIDELLAGIDGWLAAARPDVVLLHVGTNDMVQNYHVDSAPARLSELLSRIRARVFVAQIIDSTDPPVSERIERYNAAIPDLAHQYKATVVNMFDVVPRSEFADPYHPNAAGYTRLGDAWFNAMTRAEKTR